MSTGRAIEIAAAHMLNGVAAGVGSLPGLPATIVAGVAAAAADVLLAGGTKDELIGNLREMADERRSVADEVPGMVDDALAAHPPSVPDEEPDED